MPEHIPFCLVAGLGNPGPRYAETRHNAGFRLVDLLAERYGTAFKSSARFFGETAELRVEGRVVRLLKPHTFMNHSGRAVAAMSHFFRCPAEGILVAHDEIDLPPGTLRLKRGGGTGGHRGLEDIAPALGSRAFSRIRIGVGHPGSASEVIGHVLRRAPAGEQALIDEAIESVLPHFESMLDGNLEPAMNVLHTRSRVASEQSDDRENK